MSAAQEPGAILASLGISEPDDVAPVTGGWDTTLWRVEAQGETYALRVFPPGRSQTARREALVMRALGSLGLPMPAIHGMSEDPPALLIGWCPGRPLLAEVRRRPIKIWRLGQEMGRVHARIHSAPVSEAMLQALPAIHDIDTGSSKTAVVHMDYHPLNLMTDGLIITGVLDWANVALGDYRVDLARTVTLLRLAPLPPGTPSVFAAALRAILELAWRRGYRERQPTNPFTNMDPFYVWAGSMMERDLRPKLGKPGVWLQETDLLRIHRWTMARRQRGLIAPDDA